MGPCSIVAQARTTFRHSNFPTSKVDLAWDPAKCSGDLRLAKHEASKAAEAFGDYSTVLANEGFISGVHLWLVKVRGWSRWEVSRAWRTAWCTVSYES